MSKVAKANLSWSAVINYKWIIFKMYVCQWNVFISRFINLVFSFSSFHDQDVLLFIVTTWGIWFMFSAIYMLALVYVSTSIIFVCEVRAWATAHVSFLVLIHVNCSSIIHSYVVCLGRLRFDRDWKKIESFVGSKTVIQVTTYHSQIYHISCICR